MQCNCLCYDGTHYFVIPPLGFPFSIYLIGNSSLVRIPQLSIFSVLKSCPRITLGGEGEARTVVGSVRVGLTDRLMTHHMEMLVESIPEGENHVFASSLSIKKTARVLNRTRKQKQRACPHTHTHTVE